MHRITKLVTLALLVATPAHSAEPTHDRAAVQQLMRDKLAAMVQVHEAMARSDLASLPSPLAKLDALANSATWKMLRTTDYRRPSRVFQDAVFDLDAAAKQKNAAAATLPYLRLTMACVECHASVRATLVP